MRCTAIDTPPPHDVQIIQLEIGFEWRSQRRGKRSSRREPVYLIWWWGDISGTAEEGISNKVADDITILVTEVVLGCFA